MTTPELLTDRAVAVTGASRGIGAAIARRVAEAGGRVLAVSRSGTAPEHPGIAALGADICDDDAPDRIVAATLDAFGRFDGLVNCAAINHHADCWEHDDASWDAVFETNLTAPFRLSQRAVAHWLDGGIPGVIVNITSIESEVVCPQQCAYAATKGGLLGLTRSMAVELSGRDIRIVCLAPGYTATEADTVNPEGLDVLIPQGRMAQPDEIAGAAVFLLSDLAGYATGTTLFVDGGYTAR
jgi:NAD(P)-dependent dehydrogenase (short-subunit alcohol dehydrogenase family)